ncbi:MAG TPA: Crp/Fnr family transcriptional regulator [Nitrospirales bacterium]|nr:Crp/Fnr family transcriptional regulator [Nitrospirales bacterium]
MTMENADFIRLARDPILELIKQHHALAMKILITLSRRVREVSGQLRSMSMFDVYGRIVRCLIRLSQHDGERPTGRLVVENRPSNRDLAKMIGCTRESVSRAMKVLQENQFVTTVQKDIVIEERALHRYWDFGM